MSVSFKEPSRAQEPPIPYFEIKQKDLVDCLFQFNLGQVMFYQVNHRKKNITYIKYKVRGFCAHQELQGKTPFFITGILKTNTSPFWVCRNVSPTLLLWSDMRIWSGRPWTWLKRYFGISGLTKLVLIFYLSFFISTEIC